MSEEEYVDQGAFVLPEDFDDIEEDQPVPENEYEVRIKSAELKKAGPNSKMPGNPMIAMIIDIPSHPDAPGIFENISYPYEGCHKFLKQQLKRFVQAFQVPISSEGIDVLSLPGLIAHVVIECKKNPQTGRFENKIKYPDIA